MDTINAQEQYENACKEFDAFDINDITDGDFASIIFQTIASIYADWETYPAIAARIYELIGADVSDETADNAESAGEMLEEAGDALCNYLNAALPDDEWRTFATEWYDAEFVLTFGGDTDEAKL